MKPSLSWDAQVDLLVERGLIISDRASCAAFLAANNYYRFSGYMRYFQKAPHLGDNGFQPGTSVDEIRAIYDADEALRSVLSQRLARAEVLLRTHTAHVIADEYGPCGRYLEQDFYTDARNLEPTVESCLKDIERSKERHILRYTTGGGPSDFAGLPVWSAVEAFSFGTLSKCIERGGQGSLADAVATSVGVAKGGFPYRLRALVYLRNRCAHHTRLWHHSVIDAGPTPNNVRVKAKKLAGQFEPRSVLDVVASLDDIVVRGKAADPVLPELLHQHHRTSALWRGLCHPVLETGVTGGTVGAVLYEQLGPSGKRAQALTRIFDNIKQDLGSHLEKTLQVSNTMDVAVGYFNLRGWAVFDQLVRVRAENWNEGDPPIVRILIGMVTAGVQQETLEALQADLEGTGVSDADANAARERKAILIEQLRLQLMRGLPTAADRAVLQSLRDLLSTGAIEIKVHTRRPLHGKAYVCHREDLNNPITGFVGSSNLTRPGLTVNYELNVDVLDTTAAATLAQWFVDRWDDKFSRPITADLLDLLDESWARREPRRPYDVFLKVCYDLSRDVREGLAEYSIPGMISEQLLEYQATAVQTLARRIMTRNGTMLGDVVGLGKTLTAIAVALMLRDEHGYMPLVVCPKNLVSMWEEHFEAYELHGRVVPYSMAHAVLPTLRRYQLVIVDESHTLRNDTRRDYKAIQDYIHANDSKALLLTATPYNIRFQDVANQLSLYIDDDDDLGIAPVNAMLADPKLVDKVDGKTTTMAAFRRSEDPDDWKRLMSEHLVRRTRTFIKNNFAQTDADGPYLEFANGSRFRFPQRIPKPVDHSFGENDPAALMAGDITLDTITSLRLPRYELGNYRSSTTAPTEAEQEFIDNLARGRGHVAGFVRTTFYKRLSSCGHSFTLSLKRHVARNELFLYAIDNGLAIPAGTITENQFGEDDDPNNENDEDTTASAEARHATLQESNPAGLTWLRPELFTPALREALVKDTTALRALLTLYGDWKPETDSKLDALINLLQTDHRDEKVLVFTEYKDTAEYIGAALRAAGIDNVGVATGDSENPTHLAQRFSPLSNTLPGHEPDDTPGDELRVLIATDVLSEGQNLQDAHIVVNYDLPWAIIRLIQRAGRVDRVGQKADNVLLYSFFHESVDNVIDLRRRISARLHANAEAFGSDELFFGSDGETQTIADLYNGTLDDNDSGEDVDASSLAYQHWTRAAGEDAELAAKIAGLPDMISATRRKRMTDNETGVVCYVRTDSGIDGFGRASDGGTTALLTGHEVLKTFEAAPEEPGLEVADDHDKLMATLVRGVLATPTLAAGRLRGVRRTLWNRLGATLHSHNADTSVALDDLYQHPLAKDAENRLRRAVRNGASDDELATLITAIHRDGDLTVTGRAGNDPIRIVSSMGIRA